jgi:hypothetical protein
VNCEDKDNFYCFSTGLIADGKERVWMKSLIHTYVGKKVILANLKQAGNCKQVSGLAPMTKPSSAIVNGITV